MKFSGNIPTTILMLAVASRNIQVQISLIFSLPQKWILLCLFFNFPINPLLRFLSCQDFHPLITLIEFLKRLMVYLQANIEKALSNNVIKVIKRNAYGYHKFENLRKRIFLVSSENSHQVTTWWEHFGKFIQLFYFSSPQHLT